MFYIICFLFFFRFSAAHVDIHWWCCFSYIVFLSFKLNFGCQCGLWRATSHKHHTQNVTRTFISSQPKKKSLLAINAINRKESPDFISTTTFVILWNFGNFTQSMSNCYMSILQISKHYSVDFVNTHSSWCQDIRLW